MRKKWIGDRPTLPHYFTFELKQTSLLFGERILKLRQGKRDRVEFWESEAVCIFFGSRGSRCRKTRFFRVFRAVVRPTQHVHQGTLSFHGDGGSRRWVIRTCRGRRWSRVI